MFEINRHTISDSRQSPIDGIERSVLFDIVLWSDPFSLQNSPKRFCNVQMRRIWRKIEQVKPSLLPKVTKLLYFPIPVYTGIVKNNKCVFLNLERECIKKLNNLVRNNAFRRTESVVSIISVYHSEDVDSVCFQRRDIDILVTELPPVGDIPFGADMAFISKVKIDFTVSFQLFKFLQLLGFVLIELR